MTSRTSLPRYRFGLASALVDVVAPGEPAILAPGAIVDGACWLALCYDRARYDEYAADRLLATVCERLTAR